MRAKVKRATRAANRKRLHGCYLFDWPDESGVKPEFETGDTASAPLGSALYGETVVGRRQLELESKGDLTEESWPFRVCLNRRDNGSARRTQSD